MSRPYRQIDATVTYEGYRDEGALLAKTRALQSWRPSRYGGRPRRVYQWRPTPFADDLILSLYQMHLTETRPVCRMVPSPHGA